MFLGGLKFSEINLSLIRLLTGFAEIEMVGHLTFSYHSNFFNVEKVASFNYRQSKYREALRWEIFMEQELRFGLDLGRLAVLEKGPGPIMSNFLGWFFHVFRGQKHVKNFL